GGRARQVSLLEPQDASHGGRNRRDQFSPGRMHESRTPALRATYRVQLHAEFTLRDAVGIVPYLDEVGISHLYASPVLAARKGSRHGYDVIDPKRINPELGTDADLRALSNVLHTRGL